MREALNGISAILPNQLQSFVQKSLTTSHHTCEKEVFQGLTNIAVGAEVILPNSDITEKEVLVTRKEV